MELIDLRPGELCHNFSISNDLTQMVNFPTRIPDCDSHSAALSDLFLFTLVFVLKLLSLHWEILVMLLSQFSLTFCQIQNGMVVVIVREMFHRRISLN